PAILRAEHLDRPLRGVGVGHHAVLEQVRAGRLHLGAPGQRGHHRLVDARGPGLRHHVRDHLGADPRRGGAGVPVAQARPGLPAAPNGGMTARNASSRSGGISISDMPLSTTASESSTPDPPAPVMMTTFSPAGAGSTGSARPYSSSSLSPGARTTPAWRRMSS